MSQRVALVTGAGGSIGAHAAAALAGAGFAVAVNDIDAVAAERTVHAIAAAGGTARAYAADVRDSAAIAAMVQAIEEQQGELGVLVNNAGNPGRFSLLVDMSDDVWATTLQVHLSGAFFLIRACARRMLPRRWGRIVNIASLAGLQGTVGSGEYGAAKAGLINLTRTAAKELGPHGITVNAIAPGMVATPINLALQAKGSAFISSALQGIPGARLIEPAEIAALVAYLASEAAASINGSTIPIDGGAAVTLTTDPYMRGQLASRSAFLKGVRDESDG